MTWGISIVLNMMFKIYRFLMLLVWACRGSSNNIRGIFLRDLGTSLRGLLYTCSV